MLKIQKNRLHLKTVMLNKKKHIFNIINITICKKTAKNSKNGSICN